jgi:hypothetical protein
VVAPTITTYRKVGAFYIACNGDLSPIAAQLTGMDRMRAQRRTLQELAPVEGKTRILSTEEPVVVPSKRHQDRRTALIADPAGNLQNAI